MRIKEGFIVKNIGDHDIVVPVGERAIDFNGVITLNKSAKLLFEELQSGASYEDLVQMMLNTYDAPQTLIEADINMFIDLLKEKKLLEV